MPNTEKCCVLLILKSFLELSFNSPLTILQGMFKTHTALPWPIYLLDMSPIEHERDFIGQRLACDSHHPTAFTDEFWVYLQI